MLSDLLLLMERPEVVIGLILLVTGIRVCWIAYRKAHPLPQPEMAVPARGRVSHTTGKATPRPKAAVRRRKDRVLEAIDSLLLVLVVVFGLVRPFVLQTFFISSESMAPTLQWQDQLIAEKLTYRFRPPKRDDVIVFKPPLDAVIASKQDAQGRFVWCLRTWLMENPGKLAQLDPGANEKKLLAGLPPIPKYHDAFIKRVVGLPGDHLHLAAKTASGEQHLQNRGLYCNGVWQAERFLPATVWDGQTVAFPAPVPPPGNPPTLAQVEQEIRTRIPLYPLYSVMSICADPQKQFLSDLSNWTHLWFSYRLYDRHIKPYLQQGDFVVPRNSAFVLGDNRGNSFDSRFWGVVPRKNITGHAACTFWPLNRLKLLNSSPVADD